MPLRMVLGMIVFAGALLCERATMAIHPTAVSDPGGKTSLQLAKMIADEANGVVVVPASVSTTVNDAANSFPASDTRTYGDFTGGVTAPGSSLPTINGGPTAKYAGGIDIDVGVCLCTGRMTDGIVEPAQGVGVQGPNNGNGKHDDGTATNEGEISTVIFPPIFDPNVNTAKDQDFVQAVFGANDPGGGDASVLQFNVTISSPGFLRISFVFGSDEAPFFLTDPFNDSFAILIKGENVATLTSNSMTTPFTLQDMAQCPVLYLKNDVAPAPQTLVGSLHGTAGAPLYDIEFGGFTKKLTRETRYPLAPGTYTVKIVIQDVADRRLDSALFVAQSSLKLFSLAQGDYNMNGIVDAIDYTVWRDHLGKTNATFADGDGDGNGVVDAGDYYTWVINFGHTGHRNFPADFNRDGSVNYSDFLILRQYYSILSHCASRFEGDANGDGAVDINDYYILLDEYGLNSPGGGGGNMAMVAGGGDSGGAGGADESTDVSAEEMNAMVAKLGGTVDQDLVESLKKKIENGADAVGLAADEFLAPAIKAKLPENPDINGDGKVDGVDTAAIDKILGLSQ